MNKSNSVVLFCCLVLFVSQFLFLSWGDADSNVRRAILVVNLLFLLWQAGKALTGVCSLPFLAKWIPVFLVYQSIYAFANIEMLTAYLPTIFLVFLFFYVGLGIGVLGKGHKIGVVAIALLLIYVPQYFLFNESRIVREDLLHRYSNNFGYLFLLLVPMFLFFKNRIIQLVFVLISSGFCVMCFKRGAILILAGILGIYLWSVLKSDVKYKWLFVVGALLPVGIVSGIYLVESSEMIFYRFQTVSDGSGRADMYNLILTGAIDSPFSFLIGHGFFTTYELFYEKLGVALMAHSDYFQVLYDCGLIGCFVYGLLMVGGVRILTDVRKKAPEYYWITFILLFAWFSKALISGVMVDKSCAMIFLCLGYVSGVTCRRYYQFGSNKDFNNRKVSCHG